MSRTTRRTCSYTTRWDSPDAHALRLVGTTADKAHIGEPEGAGRYGQLLEAAADGDPQAIAWLAWTHRPKLTHRGHDLYRADPAEWGSACLEALYSTVRKAVAADVTSSRWCRRWMTQRLCAQLARHARSECDRFRRERTGTIQLHDPSSEASWELPTHGASAPTPGLRAALNEALNQVDVATREAFLALADDSSPGRITEIAQQHQITPGALRQRLHRARRRLQPHLADWMAAA